MLKSPELIFRFLELINADKMYAIKHPCKTMAQYFILYDFFCGLSAS